MQLCEDDKGYPDICLGSVGTDGERLEFVALSFLGMTVETFARPISACAEAKFEFTLAPAHFPQCLGPRA